MTTSKSKPALGNKLLTTESKPSQHKFKALNGANDLRTSPFLLHVNFLVIQTRIVISPLGKLIKQEFKHAVPYMALNAL
jgi:hypothetical protein